MWKAGFATFPQFPQHDDDVLPMSLEDPVTYVSGPFIVIVLELKRRSVEAQW